MADNFQKLETVRYWTQKAIPLVYDNSLSLYQLMGKVIKQLNILITNNNDLPDFIADLIREYISSGAIEEVVQEILSNYILNVKYPPTGITPAAGDGTADDTSAVQGCIDYASARGGGAVYFPYGAYSIQSITLPSNVSLFGFDRYSTRLVLRGGVTQPMISSTGTNFSICRLTLDGNAGVQVNDINILSLISQDVLLSDLIIKDGYQLLVYNGTGGHLQMNNIVFGNTVYGCVNISGNSAVQAKNLEFTQLSAVSGADVINISSDGGMYDFISNATCDTCLSVSGNDNYFIGLVTGATTPYVDSGLRNTIDFKGNEAKEYYSSNTDTTIDGDFGLTTNGAYSENISGAFTSVRNSTESKIVTGASIEQYNLTQTENVTGKKTINAQDIFLNTTNPLQYKTPIELNKYFKYIEFKDKNNITYNVLVENDLSNIGDDFLNPIDFGAIFDGITDDTESLNACFEEAKTTGKKVVFPYGKSFMLRSNSAVTVPVETDFNYCTLVVTGNQSGRTLILQNSETDTISNISITDTTRISDNRLFSKIFYLTTNIPLGVRSGTNVYFNTTVITDEYGYILNGPLPFNLVDGSTYNATLITNSNLNRIGIKNLNIDYSNLSLTSGTWTDTIVACSNSFINGITFKSNTQVIAEGRVITVPTGTAFCEISNVFGSSPWGLNSSGYVLFGSGSYITIKNCVFGQMNNSTWGTIGLDYCDNWTFENVLTQRFDVHYLSFGSMVYNNCQCNVFNIPCLMLGTINVNNSTFYTSYTTDTLINTRNDFNNIINGNITFNNSYFRYGNQTNESLLDYNPFGDNSSVGTYFIKRYNKIIFKNCKIETTNTTIVYTDIQSVAQGNCELIFDNCDFTSTNAVLNMAKNNSDYNFKRLIIKNCTFTVGHNFLDGSTTYPEIYIDNCDFGTNLLLVTGTQTTLKVCHTIFGGMTAGINANTVILTDNLITTDRSLTLGTVTNQLSNNNLMISSTKTNQASWNNVIV